MLRGRAPRRAIARVTVRGGATLHTRLRLRVRASGAPRRAVATRVRRARFRATIEGTRTIRWSVDTTDTDPACGETHHGSGREVIRFRSARPQRLTVRRGRSGVPSFVIGRRWAQFDTRGRVSRTGSLTAVPHPNGVPCGGGAPGGDPTPAPVSDCGTKRFSHLPVIPVPLGPNALRIDVGDPAPLPPFSDCPVYGEAFPQLLTAGRTRLPAAELFDPEIGKEVVLGGGHRHESAAGITVDARLNWTLTLERIRRP